jgi:hypothetical protein
MHPSAAKAGAGMDAKRGTAEAVPFQSHCYMWFMSFMRMPLQSPSLPKELRYPS